LRFEKVITGREHPDLSEATGWDGSVYSRLVVDNGQRKSSGPDEDARAAVARALQTHPSYMRSLKTSDERIDRVVVPRVLVIDDEDFIRDLYRDVFEAKGMTVFSAQTGDEALRVFKTMVHKPDIIIMDHRMPGKDGIETTKELMKIDPSVPIIFSSADEGIREEALEAGAVSFWAKPFPVGMLVNAMIDLVEARRKKDSMHFH
jgi:two-component system chemotaxis response regulator CheY